MWLNCTHSKVNPDDVDRLVQVISGEASLKVIQAARGFRGLYLVESTERRGEVVAITVWASAEEGQAYLASPACQQVIEGVQAILHLPLEREYYDVLLITEAQAEGLSR